MRSSGVAGCRPLALSDPNPDELFDEFWKNPANSSVTQFIMSPYQFGFRATGVLDAQVAGKKHLDVVSLHGGVRDGGREEGEGRDSGFWGCARGVQEGNSGIREHFKH